MRVQQRPGESYSGYLARLKRHASKKRGRFRLPTVRLKNRGSPKGYLGAPVRFYPVEYILCLIGAIASLYLTFFFIERISEAGDFNTYMVFVFLLFTFLLLILSFTSVRAHVRQSREERREE